MNFWQIILYHAGMFVLVGLACTIIASVFIMLIAAGVYEGLRHFEEKKEKVKQ